MNDFIIKMGQVESVDDNADGLRIKARISQDGNINLSDLPYSYPLMPKMFQSVPKVGECVLIIASNPNNKDSNRFYIGPVISQYQKYDYDPYMYGRGSSISLLQGGNVEPMEKISNYEQTNGSFPKKEDVAIVGRKSEDIVLKPGEIDLRCGIRTKNYDENDNLLGDVIFNNINPSYIQLKYKNGLCRKLTQEADSVINIVSDKINLISHKDVNSFNLTDKNELIKSDELDSIMEKLHKIPYGDILVEALEKIREAIKTHVHPYPGLSPCLDYNMINLSNLNFNEILSDNVRIS